MILGRWGPTPLPDRLGRGLFWIGVPLGILAFLPQAPLHQNLWLAPLVAWGAVGLGGGLAWLVARTQAWPPPTQGSFILGSMVGNTGYLGYPVVLLLVGPAGFAWALFYDLLGTTVAAYGLGVMVAAHFDQNPRTRLLGALAANPALGSLVLGLVLHGISLPVWLRLGLDTVGWTVVVLALVLIGMRISRLPRRQPWRRLGSLLALKMLLVPLVVAAGLAWGNLGGDLARVLVLQAAMPPAFATLVIAEAYNLDRDLAATTLALGAVLLPLGLPLWVWLT